MPLDVAGVPLRVRAHLVRLAPERKDALRRAWGAIRRVPAAPIVDPAADAWLVERVVGIVGDVLEVGPDAVVARTLGRPAVVLDPFGRADATYVGPIGPVLGDDRFDAVVVPRLGAEDPAAADAAQALATLVGVLRPGGVLVAVLDGALDPVALRSVPGELDAEVELAPIAGSAATGLRAVRR